MYIMQKVVSKPRRHGSTQMQTRQPSRPNSIDFAPPNGGRMTDPSSKTEGRKVCVRERERVCVCERESVCG